MKQVAKHFLYCSVLMFITILTSCSKDDITNIDYSKEICDGSSKLVYSVAKQQITSNEYLEFSIRVVTSDTNLVKFPDITDIERFIKVDQVLSNGKAVGLDHVEFLCRYVFEPTVPGEFVIPSFDVTIIHNHDETFIKTSPVAIKVKSLFADGEPISIMDIEPKIENGSNTVYYLIGMTILVIIVLFLSFKKTYYVESKSPEDKAKYDISKLQITDANYAFKLRKICVCYLEKQVDKKLRTLSNEEIIDILKQKRIFNLELLSQTEKLFYKINLSKFSKENPSTDDLCALALEFISRSSVSFEVSKEFACKEES